MPYVHPEEKNGQSQHYNNMISRYKTFYKLVLEIKQYPKRGFENCLSQKYLFIRFALELTKAHMKSKFLTFTLRTMKTRYKMREIPNV